MRCATGKFYFYYSTCTFVSPTINCCLEKAKHWLSTKTTTSSDVFIHNRRRVQSQSYWLRALKLRWSVKASFYFDLHLVESKGSLLRFELALKYSSKRFIAKVIIRNKQTNVEKKNVHLSLCRLWIELNCNESIDWSIFTNNNSKNNKKLVTLLNLAVSITSDASSSSACLESVPHLCV